MKEIDKDFIDEKGNKNTLQIESENDFDLKLPGKYKLCNFNRKDDKKKNIFTKDINLNLFGKKNKEKGNNIFTKDIGVGSSGFTQVASLSVIIAIAMLVVMYVLFKF